jgi:STE24 endopeptidase
LPFLVLLVLTLVCLQGVWPEPFWRFGQTAGLPAGQLESTDWLSVGTSALLTWLGITALAAAAASWSQLLARRLRQQSGQRESLLVCCGKQRRQLVIALILYFIAALYLLGWGWTARSLLAYSDRSLPGAELLILAPFLVGLLVLWTFAYDVERAVQETSARAADSPFPGRAAYVVLQARHNLLLALPPLILLLLQQVILSLVPKDLRSSDWLVPLLAFGLLAGVFVGIPWVLRWYLGLRPLEDGPLRQRLLATARRLRFRCNDILLWNTRHTIANAMVTGPLPVLRYVVLTDRLVRDMTPDEIEAVFGHEVGHIKHHHMLFYLGFLLASLVVLACSFKALEQPATALLDSFLPGWQAWRETFEVLTALPIIGLIGGYVFIVFGYLSRRCERQADIFGCRTVSVPVFIDALEKVALLNGISRDRPGWLSSWQHSTIARRVEFLRQLSADPSLGHRFQRRVGLLKWGMACCLGGVLVALWVVLQENFWTLLKDL